MSNPGTKRSTATHSFRREKIENTTKIINEKWFTNDILPNLNAQDYTSMFNIAITLNLPVTVQYTLDGGATYLDINGGMPITEGVDFPFSITVSNGDVINLRTQNADGADIKRVLVSEAFSQTFEERLTPPLPKEPILEISKGNVPGSNTMAIFGQNTAVGSAFEDINNLGGTYTYLTSAEILDISSTDINDTIVGTGARLLFVDGLDDNLDQIFEIVAMNGTTTVTTTQAFKRVNLVLVIESGTPTGVIGTIDLVASITGGTPQARIEPVFNSSSMANFTVPNNHTLFIIDEVYSVGKNEDAEGSIFVRLPPIFPFFSNGPFLAGSIQRLFQDQTTLDNGFFPLTQQTDIALRAINSSGGTASVTGILICVLVNNDYLP